MCRRCVWSSLALVAALLLVAGCTTAPGVIYQSSVWHELSRAPDSFSSLAFSDGSHGWAVSLDSAGGKNRVNGRTA
jgi:photosystem II stability/assembly factor-like uncharacterized protein